MTINYLVRQLRTTDNYDEGLLYADTAIALGTKLLTVTAPSDSALVKKIRSEMGIAWNHKGEIYRGQGIYPKAMECYLKLLGISEEVHNNRGIAVAYNNMGIV